jgi:hypothetical protein
MGWTEEGVDGQDAVEDDAEMEGKRAGHVTRDSIPVRRLKEVADEDVGSLDLSFIAQTIQVSVVCLNKRLYGTSRPHQKSNIFYAYQSCTCILYFYSFHTSRGHAQDEGHFPDKQTGGSPL